jgi:radical SAM protein with 4Fe4S-binding SPASM domain
MNSQPTYTIQPLTACNWELTLKCTLHCSHCGSGAGRARANELKLDECLKVADELVVLGCQELTMIGGEVFLFKGWEVLSAHLADRSVKANIVSNGYRLGEAELEQIKRAKLVNIGISIDGMEAHHNQIRGRVDAFDRLRKTFSLLRANGISIGAVTSLMKFNCADLEELYHFLVEQGVQVWQLQLVSLMGNMANRDELAVSRRQVQRITSFIRDKNRERKILVLAADSIGYFDDNEAYIRGRSSPICCWGGCKAGLSSVFIDSVGNIKGCGALYSDAFIEGNVRNTSLSDIWNSPDTFAYNRKFTTDLLTGKCKGCEVGDICQGGCRSSNFFSSNSLYTSTVCCRRRD